MSVKASLARFFGVALLLIILIFVFSLIWLAKNNWGASQYLIITLEAVLVVIGITSSKLLIVPPLSLLTGYLRATLYIALAMFLVGGIMALSHDKPVGWVLIATGFLIVLALYYRIDILFKLIVLESQLHKNERLKIGAAFSAAVFILLAFTQGITNSTTWLMTIFWFCTAIEFLTIKSRMAVAVNFIPGGATKEDREAYIRHYEKTRTYTDEEMAHKHLEMDVSMAVNAKNHRAFFSMILFLIGYYIFSVIVGFSIVFLYAFQTAKTKTEAA